MFISCLLTVELQHFRWDGEREGEGDESMKVCVFKVWHETGHYVTPEGEAEGAVDAELVGRNDVVVEPHVEPARPAKIDARILLHCRNARECIFVSKVRNAVREKGEDAITQPLGGWGEEGGVFLHFKKAFVETSESEKGSKHIFAFS